MGKKRNNLTLDHWRKNFLKKFFFCHWVENRKKKPSATGSTRETLTKAQKASKKIRPKIMAVWRPEWAHAIR